MIPVAEARARLLALAHPMPVETAALRHAAGRVLAEPVAAAAAQPPHAASAMDGYALTGAVAAGDRLRVIGASPAGRPWDGPTPGPGEALRIFTGGVMPEGCDRVLIQEDAEADGDGTIRVREAPGAGQHVRPAGADFAAGFTMAPRRLGARDLALLAAMDVASPPVRRRPRVAIAMTGDELIHPGEPARPGAVRASNGYGLAALVEAEGAEARLLPVAPDRPEALAAILALAADADLLLTVGGASVGEHDLVAGQAATLDFHKVAMRPGKPLMAGRHGNAMLIGLPGNPVSAMVCGVIFVVPVLRAMQGLAPGPDAATASLAAPLPANGPREHYMRARREADGRVAAAARQDSALLSVLADADCLILRPPHAPAAEAGEAVEVIDLPR